VPLALGGVIAVLICLTEEFMLTSLQVQKDMTAEITEFPEILIGHPLQKLYTVYSLEMKEKYFIGDGRSNGECDLRQFRAGWCTSAVNDGGHFPRVHTGDLALAES
jgi:hypothetical protein